MHVSSADIYFGLFFFFAAHRVSCQCSREEPGSYYSMYMAHVVGPGSALLPLTRGCPLINEYYFRLIIFVPLL